MTYTNSFCIKITNKYAIIRHAKPKRKKNINRLKC